MNSTQKQYIDVVLILAKCIILKSYCYLRSFVKQDCACQKVVDYQYNITKDNQSTFVRLYSKIMASSSIQLFSLQTIINLHKV